MKVYLGDGAYAEFEAVDAHSLRVSTSDGIRDTNEVFLGPHEFGELVRLAVQRPLFADAIQRVLKP